MGAFEKLFYVVLMYVLGISIYLYVLAGVLFNLDFRRFYGYSLFSIMASTYSSTFIYLLLIYFHFGSGE